MGDGALYSADKIVHVISIFIGGVSLGVTDENFKEFIGRIAKTLRDLL